MFGIGVYFIGIVIYFVFVLLWGIVFVVIWLWFCWCGFEVMFVVLFFVIVVWIVMYVLIMIVLSNYLNYFDLNVIIGGFMLYFVFVVLFVLVVKCSFVL